MGSKCLQLIGIKGSILHKVGKVCLFHTMFEQDTSDGNVYTESPQFLIYRSEITVLGPLH